MDSWHLIDGRAPADDPADFPSVALASEAELRQHLARLRNLAPGVVSLTGPAGGSLQLGIGGPFAGIRWYHDPRGSGRVRELLADRQYHPTRIDFLAEGDFIAFWPEHLMPVEQAIEVVTFFFRNQRLPDAAAYREWDAARSRWVLFQASGVRSA